MSPSLNRRHKKAIETVPDYIHDFSLPSSDSVFYTAIDGFIKNKERNLKQSFDGRWLLGLKKGESVLLGLPEGRFFLLNSRSGKALNITEWVGANGRSRLAPLLNLKNSHYSTLENKIGFGFDVSPDYSMFVLLHELGHALEKWFGLLWIQLLWDRKMEWRSERLANAFSLIASREIFTLLNLSPPTIATKKEQIHFLKENLRTYQLVAEKQGYSVQVVR